MEHKNFKTGFYDKNFLSSPGTIDNSHHLNWSDLQDEEKLDRYNSYNKVFLVLMPIIGLGCWIAYLLLRNY